MKISYIENKYTEMWLENDIIYFVYKPDLKRINIDIAKKMVNERLKTFNNISRPVFIDTCNAKGIDEDAREYMAAGDAMKYLNATALLVHNRVSKLVANFYIALSWPKIPTKVFTDKKKALKWLEKYKKLKVNQDSLASFEKN